ncbi:MAG TPA: 16S rRNA (uracil(1498)-N(3))-methyltransferase [Flavobacteriales bacterium]|nr:16S rRNA (uracil(1498)-N(3))-methyltransferase [Flavobacteriales bacterium]
MQPIFYDADLTAQQNQFILKEPESKHAIKVLRLSVNDTLILVNGKGLIAKAKVIDAHPKRCAVLITDKHENYNPLPYYLHVAVAPTKNIDRIEWFVEKATEVGISEISFLLCDNSERKVVKIERLQKVAVAAMKQSQKAFLPKINTIEKFDKFVNIHQNFKHKFIAHCADEENKNQWAKIIREKSDSKALILIGPEGDFSKNEINLALALGFEPVALGNFRLRTETAALYATMIYSANNL